MRIIYSLFLAFCLSPLASANDNHYHHYPTHSLANALRTGTDTNGKPLYLCLARLFNSTQPGKTWEGYGRCNPPMAGKNISSTNLIYLPDNCLTTPSGKEIIENPL
ncbi:Protein of uncharacterised function (DUF3421) [Legionella donaldsonii]|uniref:Protein of uncharacterized function (DUF3421) n=1 Tax=Legionella donaldsonii TaxID=45060 RepID=A0A378J0U6_9GAMM|nr:DM9 repeat-containing protein [Legionella donaldsonii]STX40577.1 Protein of uncharacterised function (DUF3421) [Legionella donaldsonii]